MDPAHLLRALTDEQVLRALLDHPRLTRAELATATGLSKPTVGESVRRLTEAQVLVDTGERTPGGRGRGRVGSYYALAEDIGTALVVSIAPAGVVAESVNAYGTVVARADHPINRPPDPAQVTAAVQAAAKDLQNPQAAVPQPLPSVKHVPTQTKPAIVRAQPRLAVVSAADPVDRDSGRLVQLPDSPFLLGELDPVQVLAGLVAGPVSVDNDVNWAARAENGPADFAYLFLDEGLGCAIVSDSEIRRGRSGLAGEIAHVTTTGPDGRATPLIEVFGQLGLRRPGTTAIDVNRLLKATTVTGVLARAICGVLAAIVALSDPELIVIGGAWGRDPRILEAIRTEFSQLPRHVPLQPARVTTEPSLTGARLDAVHRLRTAITSDAQRSAAGAAGVV